MRLFSLLAYYLPLLLLHDNRIVDSPDGSPETSDRPSARSLVVDRLALAEKGHWLELIAKLRAALSSADQRLATQAKGELPLLRK